MNVLFISLALTIIAVVGISLYVTTKTVREANEKHIKFMEDQSEKLNRALERQSRIMSNLVESVADRLMAKNLDDYKGTSLQTPEEPENYPDPDTEMREHGYDPDNPDHVAEWNERILSENK